MREEVRGIAEVAMSAMGGMGANGRGKKGGLGGQARLQLSSSHRRKQDSHGRGLMQSGSSWASRIILEQ